MRMIVKSRSLARILAYMAKNRINLSLEAEAKLNLAFEANVESSEELGGGPMVQTTTSESQRLD